MTGQTGYAAAEQHLATHKKSGIAVVAVAKLMIDIRDSIFGQREERGNQMLHRPVDVIDFAFKTEEKHPF